MAPEFAGYVILMSHPRCSMIFVRQSKKTAHSIVSFSCEAKKKVAASSILKLSMPFNQPQVGYMF